MKKSLKISFILFILTGFATVATGQTEKGHFLLSGSGSLDFASLSVKMENDNISEDVGKMSNLEFTPGAGYFIANNLAVGLEFSLSSASEKADGDKYTETTTMLLPFARLYFGKSNVKPFVQAGIGPGWQTWGYKNDRKRKILPIMSSMAGWQNLSAQTYRLISFWGMAGQPQKLRITKTWNGNQLPVDLAVV